VVACQCEAVTRADILELRPPRYLGCGAPTSAARNLDTLILDGPLNQDQVKRLTRAGMGLCQGRRCREQISALLALAERKPLELIPLAGYRAPLRPLPMKVLREDPESGNMRALWDVWFGIPGQFSPYWDLE
jgi:hypothetical protein